MKRFLQQRLLHWTLGVFALSFSASANRTVLNSDRVLEIDGKKVFVICFTLPPPPDGIAPNGKNAIAELADAGATFVRSGPLGKDWDDARFAAEKKMEDAAAKYGLHCWLNLRESAVVTDRTKEELLRKVITTFKDHPALACYKGTDEPEWAKAPLAPLQRAYSIVKELDPNHPLVMIEAPRGTVKTIKYYNPVCDITGFDVFPVGYPPGRHSQYVKENHEISMVGDYARCATEVAGGEKGVWMTLQAAWSGVVKKNKTLRFPTFPEERFMTYQAIINGTRGVVYFGGQLEETLSPADAKLGWNWHFWNRVLRPVVEEIGTKSPIYPALLVADSKLPVAVTIKESFGSNAPKETAFASSQRPYSPSLTNLFPIEFCVREVGDEIFVLACNRENATTVRAEFSGLPATATGGDMLFEEPRTVKIKDGKFTDWFGPFEVHVYRFKR